MTAWTFDAPFLSGGSGSRDGEGGSLGSDEPSPPRASQFFSFFHSQYTTIAEDHHVFGETFSIRHSKTSSTLFITTGAVSRSSREGNTH